MLNAVESWIDRNPEYKHQLHDDLDCRNFIADSFSARYLAAYDKLRPGAYKADFWRYCLLCIEGGVYVDIDTVCEASLSSFLKPSDQLVSVRGPFLDFAIWQGFLAVAQGHPLIEATLEHVVSNIERCFYGESGVWPTGPAAMGIAINRYARVPDRHPFNVGINDRGEHRLTLMRHSGKSKQISDCDGNYLFNAKYDGYVALRNSSSVPYPDAWRERRVYRRDGRATLARTTNRILRFLGKIKR